MDPIGVRLHFSQRDKGFQDFQKGGYTIGKITDLCNFYGKLADLWHNYRSMTPLTDLCEHTNRTSKRAPRRECSKLQIFEAHKDLRWKRIDCSKSCSFQSWTLGWNCVLKIWELANSFQPQDVLRKSLYNERVLIQGVINSKFSWLTWPKHYDFKNTIVFKRLFVNHEKVMWIRFLSIF